MKSAQVIVETESGERLAFYRGISLELARRVIRFLDFTLGSAKVIGDLKRTVEGLAAMAEGGRKR